MPKSAHPITDVSSTVVPIEDGDVVVRQKMASCNRHHVTGTRTIINDIVCWSTSKSLLLLMLECMCRVSLKYRASYKISKCDFFHKIFEYVGHDIMANGNTTAASKYDLVQNWKLPTSGDNLHSFISFCNYYNKFCSMFQLRVITLRHLYIK